MREMQVARRKVLVTLTVITSIIYIIWRMFFTLPIGAGIISLLFATLLLAVEFMGMIEMFVHYYGMSRSAQPPLPKIDYDLFPDVDIFVATYNEPIELLKKTILGCVNMQYPDTRKVHIYICDDGNRTEVRQMSEEMGVLYVTRTERESAKAGNLNNAFKNSTSPLVATFDADMIPMHDFLLSTVPYFLKNEQAKRDGEENPKHPKIGFIQTPQSFYNPDLFQFNLFSENRIPNEQDYFYRDVQLARNANNSVIYGGSNTVLAREALEEVGGFYTNSITEDFATGILIQSKGYRCYAVKDVHASGLSPTDLKSLIKQRERWARGCIQTGRRLHILLRRGLTFSQKLSYFSSITYWYSSIKRFAYIMSPIVFAVFDVVVVKCTLPQVLVFWLPMYLLSNHTLKVFSGNVRNARWDNVYETILSQSLMLSIILETIGISKNTFSVTNKSNLDIAQKNYKIRQSIPFVIYITLSVWGIARLLGMTFQSNTMAYTVVLFWLIGNMYNLIMAVIFLLGRVQVRKSERFIAKIACRVEQNGFFVSTCTSDISEIGFSFILERPEYMDAEKEFTVNFEMQAGTAIYRSTVQAMIIQVIDVGEKWKYAAKITQIDPVDWEQWMCIVHDRIPTLPQSLEQSMGFFDDLQINIKKRSEQVKTYSRKYARIFLKNKVLVPGYGEISIENFNYKYILINIEEVKGVPENLKIPISEKVTFDCTLSKGGHGDSKLYTVDNIKELILDEDYRSQLMSWLYTQSVGKVKPTVLTPKLSGESKGEFDVMKSV